MGGVQRILELYHIVQPGTQALPLNRPARMAFRPRRSKEAAWTSSAKSLPICRKPTMVTIFHKGVLGRGSQHLMNQPRAAHASALNLPTVSRPKVVISYTQPDWELARELVAHVEAHGIPCWIAGRDVPLGADRATEIVNAIAGARVMVLVFSASANTSSDVHREVERASGRGVSLLPFRIADVVPSSSLEYFLSGQNFLDAYPPPRAPHYARLCTCLNTMLTGSTATTQPSDTTVAPASTSHAREVHPPYVDAASLRHLESELAAHIGPFAEYAARHAVNAASNISALVEQLGKHIDSDVERQQFVSSCREWLQAAGGPPVEGEAPSHASEARAEPTLDAQEEPAKASIDRLPEMQSAPTEALARPAEEPMHPAEEPMRPAEVLVHPAEVPMHPAEVLVRLAEAPVAPDAPASLPRAVVDENVQFTVFRPRELVPDEWQPLLAFTHLASERSDVEVRRQAEAVLRHVIGEYRQVVQDAQDAVPRDEILTLVPKVPGVEFEPAERGFSRRGTVHLEMFLARALPQLSAQTARGKLSVHLGEHAIAELPLTMIVAAPRAANGVRSQS